MLHQNMSGHAAVDQRHDLRMQVGQWLKELREARGLSQRDLSNLTGGGYYTFVSQIEAGRGRIPPERYPDWACALGIKPHEFAKQMLRFYEPATYGMLFDDLALTGSIEA